jgi:hypothetical protein
MPAIETIEMVGPAGRRVVNAADEKMWRDKGYTRIGEDADLSKMKVAELKAHAEQKGVDITGLKKKDDIITAIQGAE